MSRGALAVPRIRGSPRARAGVIMRVNVSDSCWLPMISEAACSLGLVRIARAVRSQPYDRTRRDVTCAQTRHKQGGEDANPM